MNYETDSEQQKQNIHHDILSFQDTLPEMDVFLLDAMTDRLRVQPHSYLSRVNVQSREREACFSLYLRNHLPYLLAIFAVHYS